jgi:hypothetical protein
MNLLPRVDLLALLVADQIYRDQGSNKHIIAGTFHQLNISTFPAVFHKSIGVFIKLGSFAGSVDVGLVFEEVATGETLLRTRASGVSCQDRDCPLELALEVPPLPLPRPGRYAFKLLVNGNVIGTAEIDVRRLAALQAGP